jgi:gas vesicle structural protein
MSETGRPPAGPDDGGDWELWADDDEPRSLVELVNRLLDKGVVIAGDVTISVAGVDLVYLGLNAVLSSVSTARRSLGRPVGTDRRIGGGEPRS